MKPVTVVISLLLFSICSFAQKKTISQIKTELEQSPNPPLYVKDVLKKKFVLDTISVFSTTNFRGLPDSLAYHGKIKKVYGPYDKGRILVQVLAKLPNTFNHISQIFLDTSVFTLHIADSIAGNIIQRIKDGSASFEDMAQTYSMGGEGISKGDLGWIAEGALVPEVDREMRKHKKGEIFKVRSRTGIHILRKTDNPKQDNGYALMMRIFL